MCVKNYSERPGGSGVTNGGARGRAPLPGNLNAKTGPPLVDILIFSILCCCFFVFRGVFVFNLVWTSTTSRDSLSFLNFFSEF